MQCDNEEASLTFVPVTSFFLGCETTAAAWSPGTSYMGGIKSSNEDEKSWRLDVVVATETNELRLLQAYGPELDTSNRLLGETHGAVTDVAWCPASGYESYVATAGEDGVIQLWNLEPQAESEFPMEDGAEDAAAAAGPTCRALYLDCAVLSLSFHPKVPKLLLAIESSGVGHLIDWLASHDEVRITASFHDPVTLGMSMTQRMDMQGAGAWQMQDSDIVGALLGPRWGVWNISNGSSAPVAQGSLRGVDETCHGGFRFCPTNSRLFAIYVSSVPGHILAQSGYTTGAVSKGQTAATVQVFDSAFPATPRALDVYKQAPFQSHKVSLETTGRSSTTTLPAAYGVSSVDWLPRRVGSYDVLLVAVGCQLLPIPAA